MGWSPAAHLGTASACRSARGLLCPVPSSAWWDSPLSQGLVLGYPHPVQQLVLNLCIPPVPGLAVNPSPTWALAQLGPRLSVAPG